MKQLWKNTLPLLTKTSPIYYQGALVKENQFLKYYFFSSFLELSEITFDNAIGTQIGCESNLEDIPQNERLYYTRKPPEHYVYDDFVFEDYTIIHKGEWGYVCTKNNNVLWKKSLRGYLYTDIIRKDNRIIFGTSGYGGHFYCLDIDSGEIVFDFNTKGTSAFFHANDSFYFPLRKNKTTNIYRIDYDGNVLETLEVQGIYYDTECPIALWDQSLYIVTLIKSKGENFTPVINRIEL